MTRVWVYNRLLLLDTPLSIEHDQQQLPIGFLSFVSIFTQRIFSIKTVAGIKPQLTGCEAHLKKPILHQIDPLQNCHKRDSCGVYCLTYS